MPSNLVARGRMRVRASAALAVLLLLAVGCGAGEPAAPVHPTETGPLLWVGDLETGDLSQFQDTPWNNVGGTRPRVVTDPVRDGRYALQLGITGATDEDEGICCGSRNELVPRFRDLVPGDDLYFGFSTYLAPGFPVAEYWQVIVQFKHNFDGSPPVELDVEAGEYKLSGGGGHPVWPGQFRETLGRAVTGVWVDWVLHVRFSTDPSEGFVEVWKDSELVLPRFAPRTGTLYPAPREPDFSYVKLGYYRDADIDEPGTVYFDNWRIGTTFDAVRPGHES